MKKKNDSLFELFQDPIMTMVAMILLATLWMILPDEAKAKGTAESHDRKSTDSLHALIDKADKEINLHEIQGRRMVRELAWFEEKSGQIPESERRKADSASNDMAQKAEKLRQLASQRVEELRRLEAMLDAARKHGIRNPHGESIASVEQLLSQTQGEYEKNMSDLARLQLDLHETEARAADRRIKLEDLGRDRDELQRELASKKEERGKLQQELDALLGKPKSEGTGKFEVIYENKKDRLWIKLSNDRLLPVNRRYFDVKTGYLSMADGKITSTRGSQYSPYSSAPWQTISEINAPGGPFLSALDKVSPSDHCVVFLVDQYSFKVYREARKIARTKGFEVGWEHYEKEDVVFSQGDDDGGGLRTSKNQN
jgi:hypothetical protein